MPRHDASGATEKTDIFASGTAIFHIMKDYLPFPEPDPFGDEVELTRRHQDGFFAALGIELGGDIVHKCRAGHYSSAEEIAHKLAELC